VGASFTFPFTLPGEIAMSRVVVDGGEQHGVQRKVLMLKLIPNILHTRLPKCLQVINQGPQVHINTVTGLLWP
jgi:hypothetical protein